MQCSIMDVISCAEIELHSSPELMVWHAPICVICDFSVPSITIAGDLNDLRCYSDEQAKTQIEAFVEQLAEE